MIRIKDTITMFGAILLSFGATTVCTVFLSYYLDLSNLKIPEIKELNMIYDAQLIMSKIIASCAGGVLGSIALIVLLFSVSHFIHKNQANMGILKAIGYSDLTISLSFLKYGIPVFAGTSVGYTLGMLLAQPLYTSMSEYDALAPTVTFQWILPLALVILPSIVFSVSAFIFAYIKLQKAPLAMIKCTQKTKVAKRTVRFQNKNCSTSFLCNLKQIMRVNHPVLSLFVGIAAWGFSAMLQMAFTMMSLDMSDIAPAICAPIGIMMGFVTLLIAADFVLSVNRQYISLMKAYGYTDRECYRTLLDGYRPVAWIGFVAGTAYQYFLMKFVVSLFAGAYDVEITFHVQGFLITLLLFILYYEGVMLYYKKKVTKLPLKEAMSE